MNTRNIPLFYGRSKDIPKLSPFASWPSVLLSLSGSKYPYLEQISMVPKMFDLMEFDCIWVCKRRIMGIYMDLGM